MPKSPKSKSHMQKLPESKSSMPKSPYVKISIKTTIICHIGYYGIGYFGIGFYDFGYYVLTPIFWYFFISKTLLYSGRGITSIPVVHNSPINSVLEEGYRKKFWYSFLYMQKVLANAFVISVFIF